MINEDELIYKINAVINYLQVTNAYEYKVYNRICPDGKTEPDSNIVEYEEDVLEMVLILLNKNKKN